MSLPKNKRFAVFMRDGFTCRYCGAKGQGIKLHVDHVNPQAKGGRDDLLNLVTACADCNFGKRDVVLPTHDIPALQAAAERSFGVKDGFAACAVADFLKEMHKAGILPVGEDQVAELGEVVRLVFLWLARFPPMEPIGFKPSTDPMTVSCQRLKTNVMVLAALCIEWVAKEKEYTLLEYLNGCIDDADSVLTETLPGLA